jgi:metal-dependent amidase/aminoacylase/carboxypeptidase family protein
MLAGEVRFIFQPTGEDRVLGGAKPMIESGVMDCVDYYSEFIFPPDTPCY